MSKYPLFQKKYKHTAHKALAALLVSALTLSGCGAAGEDRTPAMAGSQEKTVTAQSVRSSSTAGSAGSETDNDTAQTVSESAVVTDGIGNAPEITGLTCTGKLNLGYAEQFSVYYYDGGYKMFVVSDTAGNSTDYLLIPDGKEAPSGLPDDVVTLQAPLDHIYMAASGSMCFFTAIGCLDDVTMTAIDRDGWTIQEPVDALNDGRMTYAGKYSEPDYEMLLDNGCDAAIESTMILHSPEVQEMLENLDIPVIIDQCSYEADPFGRMEWVKFYGALMGKEQEADDYFRQEMQSLGDYRSYTDTGRTAAFFTMNSSGQITVRRTDDFIPNLMKMAGGNYIFDDLENPAGDSVLVNLTMETFYDEAKDADYLIYNATIESPLTGISDLEEKSSLFADFKAVKDGHVWQVDRSWYQSTDHLGDLLTDFHLMFTGGDADRMTFLTPVSNGTHGDFQPRRALACPRRSSGKLGHRFARPR